MRPLAVLAVLAGLALPASCAAATTTSGTGLRQSPLPAPKPAPRATTTSTTPVSVPLSDTPPAGRRLSPNQVLAIASALPKIKAARAKYRGSFGGTYLKSPLRWQVSFFSSTGKKEIGQVFIDDASGRVLEQWTGFQVPWSMARGYPGAFGRHVNALYVWLPLCLLFALPFFNFRRPLSLSNLDLLALLSFSVSLAFFNHANIWASVPLVYPPLLYLLARMLALLRHGRAQTPARAAPLRLLVPASWLAVAVVFLLGFRIALNVTDANVIDVGYAGVIGAQRITHDRPLYGSYPSDNEHGDTYGPFNYEAYVPFQALFGWSGTWDDLPAAHAAAIAFDLLALALLFLLGQRMRGPTLGVALAYGWVTYPFTLYSLESNSNDSLVAVVIIAALLSASYRSRIAPAARGALAALAGLTKFAPLALAPVLATHELLGRRQAPLSRRAAGVSLFALGFVIAAALALVPALTHDSLHTIYERTIAYQGNRGSPFSAWGLYGGLSGLQLAVQIAAVVLAVALALIPRRADLVGLAAACAAVMIALQLGIEHWFYLYIPWFFPLVLVALLGRFGEPVRRPAAEASAPARSSQPVAALSS
ncbi:MAG TPA: hypothetical protein VGO14_11285 [Solirubrobacteraceae bacterium]|jgi:hypothetical protein|nr:hypothetical protein [Solirubrobacteraceae bacterium]